MTPEEETLQKIKHVLSSENESQAIRLIEQYGQFKQDQVKQLTLTDVVVAERTLCDSDNCVNMKPVKGTENYFCSDCGNHY